MEYFPKYTSINLMAWGGSIYKVKYLGRARRHGPMVDCLTLISSFRMQVSYVSYFYYNWVYGQGSATLLSILILPQYFTWSLAYLNLSHMVFGLLKSNSTKSHVYKLFKVFHFLHTATLIHQFNILMKKLSCKLILDSIHLRKNFETSTWIFHNYNCKNFSFKFLHTAL